MIAEVLNVLDGMEKSDLSIGSTCSVRYVMRYCIFRRREREEQFDTILALGDFGRRER